jgi:hypothetical protein
MQRLEKVVTRGLEGIEDRIRLLEPMRTLALFEKPQDRLFNKFTRLPPQSFYSEKAANDICESLRCGLDEVAACAVAMIPANIVKSWLVMGKKGIEPFQSFWLRFESSIALSEKDHIELLRQNDPVACAQLMLKNGRVSKYGKYNHNNVKHVVVEEKRAPVVKVLSPEEKANAIRAMLMPHDPSKIVEGEIVD